MRVARPWVRVNLVVGLQMVLSFGVEGLSVFSVVHARPGFVRVNTTPRTQTLPPHPTSKSQTLDNKHQNNVQYTIFSEKQNKQQRNDRIINEKPMNDK